MTAILYPVAPDAGTALQAPLGRAAREREARELAGRDVAFATEAVGETFVSREAALDAYPGLIDDDRPGRGGAVPAQDRFCQLREVVEPAQGRQPVAPPVEPTFADGRRWPAPADASLATRWRLSISYWRVEARETLQARRARHRRAAARLSPEELRDIARQPLRPVRPQQPLDVGLFESPAPEAPHILIPDE